MEARETDYLTQRKIHQIGLTLLLLAEFGRFERDNFDLDR